MSWVKDTGDGIILHLKVQPNAKETKVIGLHGNPPRLKIKLAAPPVDGKANAELLEFLKETLKIARSQLKIIRGEKSSQKDILCVGIDMNLAKKLLKDEQLELWS